MSYQPALIEKKWQDFWVTEKIFKAEIRPGKKKLYILDMFPYPSGDGLHVGHVEGYTATDIFSRFKRMQQFNVLHTIGWDAFGLPAEQYAIRTGQHPALTTLANIKNFKRQVQAMGFSYDWDREFSTADPKYFKWTQSIFLKLYHQGLAYQDKAMVNWCPELRAVLANEEVKDGLSEIGGHPVVRMPLRQWILKITAFAERLLSDLDGLDWPTSILDMQANWIGKSFGATVAFKLQGHKETLSVFTTRPDTLFGVTFLVLAPEHPLVKKITTEQARAGLDDFMEQLSRISERDRINEAKDKIGYFLGAYAEHPLTKLPIPIWIADYVLLSYGTGAIMAVPAHDKRDYDFAQRYSLPQIEVVQAPPGIKKPFSGSGISIHSDFLNGLSTEKAKKKILEYLEQNKLGTKDVQYKLRDWIFSRQRYWGEPIPLLLDRQGQAHPLSEKELPLELPKIENYTPSETGESPLARAEDWLKVQTPQGEFTRETNTMPQWAGSCWYYLRFLSAKDDNQAFDPEAEKYWMPVDLYVGGAEHAVLHLLYARFWHKVLFDLGLVHTKEPFQKLVNQGMILGEDGVKMSKSRGNVISPDVILKTYGADTLRLYEMFLGPLEKVKPWQSGAIDGSFRFLNRSWNWIFTPENLLQPYLEERKPTDSELKLLHPLIQKVTQDLEQLKFNTAISALMIFLNEVQTLKTCSLELAKVFVLLISPFVPHFGEEAWALLGGKTSLAYAQWPQSDPTYLAKDLIEIPVQINGKTRSKLMANPSVTEQELVEMALSENLLSRYLTGKEIKKVIYVPAKILNLIVPN